MRKITNEDENLDFVIKTWEVNGEYTVLIVQEHLL